MVSNLESRTKKVKGKAILLLAYIADVSCLTNRSFYMRTLSLRLETFIRTTLNGTIFVCKTYEQSFSDCSYEEY